MLKKFSLILTLFAVMPAVCMHRVIKVPKTTVKIITQDGQEFEIDIEQAKCSETLKNLIVGDADDDADSEAFKDGIPLPNVTGFIWSKIQTLLPSVLEKKDLDQKAEQTAADQQRTEQIREQMSAILLSYDGATLADLIIAFDYLDIQVLHALAIDVTKHLDHTNQIAFIKEASDSGVISNLGDNVAKNIDIKKITLEQIATLPSEIRNSIILDQIIHACGPAQLTESAVCNGHTMHVTEVCVSQDGATIASGSEDGTVCIWNMDGSLRAVCNGHGCRVTSVCVSQDGAMIVSGSEDGTVRIWNEDGTERAVCNGHTNLVNSVCISQDGTTIVSGYLDGTVRIWNNDGTQRAVCSNHTNSGSSVCISEDGTTIFSLYGDGTVRIWKNDGTERAICNGYTNWVITSDICSAFCISQDGNTMVSGSLDGTMCIWNTDGTARAAVCNCRTGWVGSAYVSQDGSTIVSGYLDGTVRIWNNDGTQLAVCNGHTNSVSSVCVSQDGNTIVSGSWDHTVRIWDISLLNRISSMDSEQAQAIWQYLQSDHAKDWNGVQSTLDA